MNLKDISTALGLTPGSAAPTRLPETLSSNLLNSMSKEEGATGPDIMQIATKNAVNWGIAMASINLLVEAGLVEQRGERWYRVKGKG